MNRLIIVYNRLPVTVRKEKGKLQILPSVGGLSTRLKGYHESSNGLWVGWSGDLSSFNPEEKSEIEARMRESAFFCTSLFHRRKYLEFFPIVRKF